jgi:hypothetical protein
LPDWKKGDLAVVTGFPRELLTQAPVWSPLSLRLYGMVVVRKSGAAFLLVYSGGEGNGGVPALQDEVLGVAALHDAVLDTP